MPGRRAGGRRRGTTDLPKDLQVYLAAVSAVSANPVPLPWESSRFPSAKGIFEWA